SVLWGLVIGSIRPDPKAVAADLGAWWPGMGDPVGDDLAPRSRRELLRLRPARRALLAAVAAQTTMLGVMSVTAAELDRRGADDLIISLLMSAHFIGMFAFGAPIGRVGGRY